MMSTRSFRGRGGVVAGVALAAVVTLALPVRASAAPTTASAGRWLIGSHSLRLIASVSLSDARHFFSLSRSFVIGHHAVSGYAAAPVDDFKSYAAFGKAVGHLHRGQWVMYDNEHWSFTPVKEQRHPAAYMRKFARLAHQHGLKVIEAPGRDLMSVPGGDCTRHRGQTTDKAYLACRIPRDARFADIYEIQAQADQPTVSSYVRFVKAARHQARAANPHIVLLAGLSTDRGGSAAQILACWKVTNKLVAGYWMNTNSATFRVATKALTRIRRAGG